MSTELVERLKPRHVADEPLARAVVSADQAERRAAVSAYLVANNALKSDAVAELTALAADRDAARKVYLTLQQSNAVLASRISTLEQAVDAFADICDELGCERDNEAGLQAAAALTAKVQEAEETNARLLSLIADIRQASGVGAKPMLDKLPVEIDRIVDERDVATAKVALMTEALEWYGERARLARLIHSGGDPARFELSDDGGKRARRALSEPDKDAT